jgi:hypothetical protein
MWQSVAAFDGHCHEERWGTVAACHLKLTDDVEAALRWGWDAGKYLSGRNEHLAMDQAQHLDQDNTRESRLDIVDSTIRDPFWWSYWRMMRHIARTLHELLVWAESCACHYELLHRSSVEDDGRVSPAVRREAERCPLRGLRCPEVASGDSTF